MAKEYTKAGTKINMLSGKLGLNISELAEKVKISRQALSAIMKGEAQPRPDTQKIINDLLSENGIDTIYNEWTDK